MSSDKDTGYNYLFTVDGHRITSIFDISKVHRVLIAGNEKYHLDPIKGFEVKEISVIKENEEKTVKSAIKQA